jgi:mono/diheme cytochrome c family protein
VRPANHPPKDAVRRAALAALALGALAVAVGLPACVDDGTPRGLYRRHCARCHGLDGTGNARAVGTQPGLDLTRSELAERGDVAAIRRRIVAGEGTMPGFGEKLTPEQIDALVALSLELAGAAPPATGSAEAR